MNLNDNEGFFILKTEKNLSCIKTSFTELNSHLHTYDCDNLKYVLLLLHCLQSLSKTYVTH